VPATTSTNGIAQGSPAARLAPVLVVGLHAALFGVLCWWSWLKWPDPIIDFGRELYVPWQITRGKVLYRDIESLFGPLSPHVNALWFRLFGVSLLTLVVVNLALFAAVVAGVHRSVRLCTDRFAASVASLATVALFGFLQLAGVGNYNFATPYAHEATHGMALAIAVVLALHAAIDRHRAAPGAIAGLAFGLLLLTKPEVSLAAAAAALAAFGGAAALGASGRRLLRTLVPLFAGCVAIPPVLFFLHLRQHMDDAVALGAVARGWTTALGTSIASSAFYVTGMGLDRPVLNAARAAMALAAFLAFVGAMVAVCRTESGWPIAPAARRIGRLALLAVAAASILLGFTRGLPLIALAAVAFAAASLARARQDRPEAMRLLALLTWSTFALVLLAKLGLNARIHHYGFYLALPAATVVIVIVCGLAPRALAARDDRAGARWCRHLATMAVIAAVAPYLVLSNALYRTKTVPVGSGADRFLATRADGYWQGVGVRDALAALESMRAPGDTLAVLPEGVMLNYLARMDSPLRVINLMPPELLAFGEAEALRALAARPPRFVVLVHRDVSEYGYPPFGSDPRYGQRTVSWVVSRYRAVARFGEQARTPSGFGLELFVRE
jgi:hypothetical protein